MKTAAECLAKATELDAMARDCPDGIARDGYFSAADGWRKTALLARHQEAWAEDHPAD
jgi:hypothetical protein